MAAAMFNQGQTSLADTLIRKVKIAGIAPPEDAAAMVGAIEGLRELDDDFYMVLTDKYEDDYVKALAAWAESTEPTETELGAGIEDHRKIYVGQTNNKELVCTNRRSIIIYSDKPEERPDAAYVGNVGPSIPRASPGNSSGPRALLCRTSPTERGTRSRRPISISSPPNTSVSM
jgi:hypothetical protein